MELHRPQTRPKFYLVVAWLVLLALLYRLGSTQACAAVSTKSNEQCVRDYVSEQSIGKMTASRGKMRIAATFIAVLAPDQVLRDIGECHAAAWRTCNHPIAR
jgi:hypothetical protein